MQSDRDLYDEYVKNPNSNEVITKIYNKYNPLIKKEVSRLSFQLPPVVVEMRLKKLILNAFKTYNPISNVPLSAWIKQNTQNINRLTSEYGEIGAIPVNRYVKLDQFNKVYKRISDRTGREPSIAEIADEMTLPEPEIARLMSELKNVNYQSAVSYEPAAIDSTEYKKDAVLRAIYYMLGNRDKVVFEYLFGFNGRPRIDNINEISSLTGINSSTVSRIKSKISSQYRDLEDVYD